MAFDACMMRAVLSEYRREFPEAKIEKVLQPRSDEVDFVIHYGGRSRRLIFNVGPNSPRLQLSDIPRENPPQPPTFCMLMRKYFSGARILSAEQLGFDRIAVFSVKCYDDMGFPVVRKIVCEIMGKYANLIVLDAEDKVTAALKFIDFAASTVRQVLPGLKYQIPAKPEKLDPLKIDRETFLERLSAFPSERTVEKFITSTYSGIATQIAHELCFRAGGGIDIPLCNIDTERLWGVLEGWQELLIAESYTPTLVIDRDGKPCDYSYMDITYLGEGLEKRQFDSFSELFDLYFAERDRIERINQRAHDLIVLLNNARARTERKLAIQREALEESKKGESYRRAGDLITANMYRLSRGMTELETVDYYDEAAPTVRVPLDPRLTPAQNAQKMYKLYNKAKTASVVLTEQIALWESELVYLDSVRAFLDSAESEEDLAEIRDELYRSGYASRLRGYRPPKKIKARHLTFTTSGGYKLLVGRNNTQNDHLTFKVAAKDDVWFHVKDMPGSHVILVTEGEEPGDAVSTEAAAVAAYYSSAGGDRVAVDYTRVKNIKKPQGAKPGFVIYKTNYTAYVKPMSGEELSENG